MKFNKEDVTGFVDLLAELKVTPSELDELENTLVNERLPKEVAEVITQAFEEMRVKLA